MPEIGHGDGNEGFDEYLWPLTDMAWPMDWRRLADRHRIRRRLDEILKHVHETHVTPRLRRLGAAHPSAVAELTQRVISGPLDGAYWERTLRDPVPSALQNEWSALTAELRELSSKPVDGHRGTTGRRSRA